MGRLCVLLQNTCRASQSRQVMLNKLQTEIIKTEKNLCLVLSVLSPDQCIAVCQAFKFQLPSIIKTAENFRDMLLVLSMDQRSAACLAFQEELLDFIKTAEDFRDVLQHLSPAQRIAIYQDFKHKLTSVINTADDFMSVLLVVPFSDQRQEIIKISKISCRA